jgi:hypothetical protein
MNAAVRQALLQRLRRGAIGKQGYSHPVHRITSSSVM